MRIKTAGLVFLISCFLTTVSLATETRTASFPGASEYLWDNSQVFLYPSVAPLYYRSVVAELGDDGGNVAANSSAYLLYANEEQSFGVVGLAVNRRSVGYEQMKEYLTPVQNDVFSVDIITRLQDRNLGLKLATIEEPKASYGILYSKKLGVITGGIIIGGSGWSSLENYSGTGEERVSSSGILEMGLGFGYEPKDNIRADAGISFNKFSFSSKYTVTAPDSSQELKSDGSKAINFFGRVFYAPNEDMVIVPLLKISYAKFGYLYDQTSDSVNGSGSSEKIGFTLGCGWNYQFRNHLKLIAGTDIGYLKTSIQDSLIIGSPGDTKESLAEWTFPAFHLAMEATLANWLTARVGATQQVVSTKRTVDYFDGTSSRTELSGQPYQLNMGLTFRTGNLNLDLLVNPELLYSGGNIASASKTWPANSAALSYRF